MNIQINGVNLIVSPRVKGLVDKKLKPRLDRLLSKFNEEIKTGFLHLEKNKYKIYQAKFDMALPGQDGHLIAHFSNKKLIPTIVGIREQLEKQIKKYKQDQVNYSLG